MPDPIQLLHFVHTADFESDTSAIPLTDDDLRALQTALCVNPAAGSPIRGTGGVRKIRVSVKRKGKRGGARVLYFYVTTRMIVYLLFAYDKSMAANVSEAGKKELRRLARLIETEESP